MDVRQHIDKVAQHPFVSERPVVKQFIKFSIVGTLNTLIDFIFFSLFLYGAHLHYLVANIFALFIAGTNSYILNRRWTWRSTDPRWRQQLAKFLVILFTGFSLNELILFILVDRVQLMPLIAKAIAVGIVLFFNFSANRWWTFRAAS